MSIKVADIMTAPVFSLNPDATVLDAHQVTRKKGIRHLPIVEPDTNKLVAIVTQKVLIARVISLMTQVGSEGLDKEEAKINVMDIALSDYDAVTEKENVADVASFFLDNKHGCLPVVDSEGCLVGILTSSDFVKLTVKLLSDDVVQG